jgi:hypothetical protein
MKKTIFVIAAAAALVLTTAGVVHAEAQSSEPGDLLYPVKAWIRQYQIRTETQSLEQLRIQQPQEPTATGDMLREQDRLQIREEDRIHQSETATPQHINSQNPWTAGTPSPESGYGPGPGTCSTCDGSQQQHQNGQETGQRQQNGSNPGNGNKP